MRTSHRNPSPARFQHAAPLAITLAAVVGLTGCLPGSGRKNDRDLSPADSASIELAATVPVDTLALAWTARAPEDDPMPLPTSLGWMDDGRLAVVETQVGSIRIFGADSTYQDRIDLPEQSYPYFAGAAGDAVAVLARGTGSVLWAVPGDGVVREVSVGEGALNAWATSPDGGTISVRFGGGTSDDPAEVQQLDAEGRPLRTVPLPNAWRASGFVRGWGAFTTVALSGYRPVVDLIQDQRADTLALQGFDSPQLPRSAQFMRGDANEPPLLTSSADALGDHLYVLNLRGDHVRVDVYGRDGVLQRILVSPRPWQVLQHVALDISARRQADGTVELAVLMQRSRGVIQPADAFLVLYRWRPEVLGDSDSTSVQEATPQP
ncbi:MAG: hypothetical protein Rubg2KO_26570 [Rubricoccaceae bacterium]